MKTLLLTSLFFLSSINFLSAQSCQECQKRFLIIYDFNVTIPLPEGEDSLLQQRINEWLHLFCITGGVKNYVWNNASSDCIVKLCSAFFTEPDSINTAIKFGAAYPNLPPAEGSVAGGANYIFCGTISGVEGSYVLQLNLETAKSRERVKGVTINFASGFDPFTVGENACSYFGNLYDTMLDFEKKKRDEGEPYAIRPEIEAVPEKTVLQKNESTTVEFTVTDCDGEPLKNRTIEISSEMGTFDKETIDTDKAGKATASFTAGMETGLAKVKGILVYRMPTEATSLSTSEGGDAVIEIEKQKYWKLVARYYWKRTDEEESRYPNISEKSNSVETHDLTFTAYLNVISPYAGHYVADGLLGINVYGGGHNFHHSYNKTIIAPEAGYEVEMRNGYCHGAYDPSEAEVDLSFNSDGPGFGFNITANTSGSTFEQIEKDYIFEGHTTETNTIECSPYEYAGQQFDAFFNEDTSYTEVENNNLPEMGYEEKTTISVSKSFIGENGVYVFDYSEKEEIVYETNIAGMSTAGKTKYEIEFSGEIIGDIVTSIEDEENLLREFYLGQNYPNPFNPVTTIKYSIPIVETRHASSVQLKIYDVLGNEIAVLVDEEKPAGIHTVLFNGSSLPSGVYFYQINAGEFSDTKKMLILK